MFKQKKLGDNDDDDDIILPQQSRNLLGSQQLQIYQYADYEVGSTNPSEITKTELENAKI